MTEVFWFKKALDFLRKLDPAESERIVKKINEVLKNPKHYLESLISINAKKLRIGDYRLFVDYDSQQNKLSIYSIRHRKNAYKK